MRLPLCLILIPFALLCHKKYIIYVKEWLVDMNTNYSEMIRERIEGAPFGTVFVGSDFKDIAGSASIRQVLKRMTEEGKLRRVMTGVYDKPRYSAFLGELVAPDIEAVAYAVARHHRWTIAPSGNIALNMLGLSTQVPAVWSFVSDGPYRSYDIGGTSIKFKHRTNREITGMSLKTSLVVQALKAMGKGQVSDEDLEKISERLTLEEKKTCLIEASGVSDWVYGLLRKICV